MTDQRKPTRLDAVKLLQLPHQSMNVVKACQKFSYFDIKGSPEEKLLYAIQQKLENAKKEGKGNKSCRDIFYGEPSYIV